MKFMVDDNKYQLNRPGIIHFKGSKLKNNVYANIFYTLSNKKYFTGSIFNKSYINGIHDLWMFNTLSKSMIKSFNIDKIRLIDNDYDLKYTFKHFIEKDRISKTIQRDRRCMILSDKIPSIFTIFNSNISPVHSSFEIIDGIKILKENRGVELDQFKTEYPYSKFYYRFFGDKSISIDELNNNIIIQNQMNLNNYPTNYIFAALSMYIINHIQDEKYIILSNIDTYLNNKEIYELLEIISIISNLTGLKILLFSSIDLSPNKISNMYESYMYYEL